MTVQEVITEVKHLSVEDRMLLLKFLRDMVPGEGASRSTASSAIRLRGALKPNGPVPTDEEVANAYADHLLEKYK
ncbi:MAG TPA: hypothetical protein VN345_18430 [Blastocatellia bacterium]|jgi:hypothetical protein|nr:hypothetical protein [Blastocatellia bacterium]